jgi:hypothetical protein
MPNHVPNRDIERLALGRLTTAESLRVQRHLFKCGDCLKHLLALEIMLAEKELLDGGGAPVPDPRKPLFIVHDTGDGFIYSKAERRGRKWFARHWGQQLDGGRECGTMREANEFLAQSFREMFPEHRCTLRCGTDPPTPAP